MAVDEIPELLQCKTAAVIFRFMEVTFGAARLYSDQQGYIQFMAVILDMVGARKIKYVNAVHE